MASIRSSLAPRCSRRPKASGSDRRIGQVTPPLDFLSRSPGARHCAHRLQRNSSVELTKAVPGLAWAHRAGCLLVVLHGAYSLCRRGKGRNSSFSRGGASGTARSTRSAPEATFGPPAASAARYGRSSRRRKFTCGAGAGPALTLVHPQLTHGWRLPGQRPEAENPRNQHAANCFKHSCPAHLTFYWLFPGNTEIKD